MEDLITVLLCGWHLNVLKVTAQCLVCCCTFRKTILCPPLIKSAFLLLLGTSQKHRLYFQALCFPGEVDTLLECVHPAVMLCSLSPKGCALLNWDNHLTLADRSLSSHQLHKEKKSSAVRSVWVQHHTSTALQALRLLLGCSETHRSLQNQSKITPHPPSLLYMIVIKFYLQTLSCLTKQWMVGALYSLFLGLLERMLFL